MNSMTNDSAEGLYVTALKGARNVFTADDGHIAAVSVISHEFFGFCHKRVNGEDCGLAGTTMCIGMIGRVSVVKTVEFKLKNLVKHFS